MTLPANDSAAIEACPWCGAKAERITASPPSGTYRLVRCTSEAACGVRGPRRRTTEQAISEWNRVASQARDVARMRTALDELLSMTDAEAADFDHQFAYDECFEAAQTQAREALKLAKDSQ